MLATACLTSIVGQTIMIPGFKLIDDILRGLPENARLRGQLEELRAQMAVLQKENEELKTKVAELSPKEDRLDDDTEKIIDLFFDEPAEWSSFDVARRFQMQESVARYHLDVLTKKRLLLPGPSRISFGPPPPPTFRMGPAGRDHVMKKRKGQPADPEQRR